MMSPWKLRPAERNHKLTLVGNCFYDPAGISVVTPTLGTFTVLIEMRVSNLTDAVLLNSPDIQYASFDGGVTVDPSSPYSGTTFPVGTPREPVNNLEDALTIATERGFSTLFIHGNITINSGFDYGYMAFVGESITKTSITIDSSANVYACDFSNAEVNGVLDGYNTFNNCRILNITYIDGFIEKCLIAGTITLSGARVARLLDCWSGSDDTSPTIDFGGSGTELVIRNYDGYLILQNKNGIDDACIDIARGKIVIAPSVTAGYIEVCGQGVCINEAGPGATVNTEFLLNSENISNSVWDEQLSEHLATGSSGEALYNAQGLTPEQATMLLEMYKLLGLDPTKPLLVTPTARKVPSDGSFINQTIVTAGSDVTVTRI